jgi:hypothetical protein
MLESAQNGLDSYISQRDMYKSLGPISPGYNRFNNTPDGAARSSSTIYLFYDKKNKVIRRNIDRTDIFYPFHRVGNAKRLDLFEILLEKRGYVETETLAEKLRCRTTKAVGTMVRNFNIYARERLQLDEKTKLVEGLEGHGYKINPDIKVLYEEK